MARKSVIQFMKAVKRDAALEEEFKAAKATADPKTYVKIAEAHGYHFTTGELQTVLSEMSEEELAIVANPGMAPRRHLQPR
jgi:predicted ribosomally synthesized peptide with nif11-like leader